MKEIPQRWIESEKVWIAKCNSNSPAQLSFRRLEDIKNHTSWRPNRWTLDELAGQIPKLKDLPERTHKAAIEWNKEYALWIFDLLDHAGFVIEEPELEVPTVFGGWDISYDQFGFNVEHRCIFSFSKKNFFPLEAMRMVYEGVLLEFKPHHRAFLGKTSEDIYCLTLDHEGFPVSETIPLAAMIAKCEAAE